MASKKKTSWKTLAGLVLAAATWRSIAEDLPIHDIIPPDTGDIKPDCGPDSQPMRYFDTDVDKWSWRCVPKGTVLCQRGYVWDTKTQQCIPERIGL